MDGIPLRPIVSNQGSACHPLNHFFVEIISPLIGRASSYVKNSAHFGERISNAPIHSNQIVSLDVVNLFKKIPIDGTHAVIRDKLAADPLLEECIYIPIDNLMEMLTFCVETTYFGMGSDIYRQEEGLEWVRHCHQYCPTYTWNTSKNGIRIDITKAINVAYIHK